MVRSIYRGLFAVLTLSLVESALADAEAGKAKVSQLCAECHRPADWNGETQAALQSLLKDVVAGKVAHGKREIKLTDQEIVDIAAYWTGGRK